MKSPKITITVFGHLSSQPNLSRDYRVAKYFLDRGVLGKVFCLGFDKNIDIPRTYLKGMNAIAKIFFRIIKLLKLVSRTFPDRLTQEWIFDMFCAYHLKRDPADLLLNLRPTIPIAVKSFKRARKHREKSIITLATVAHPRFNYSVVKKMQKLYHLPSRSIYTNWSRAKRLDETFRYSDVVLLTVNSKFILNTYKSYGTPVNKIAFLHNNRHGVNTNFFIPPQVKPNVGKVRFLTLGFLNLIKGIPLLLEAWREVNKSRRLDAKLILAGNMDKDIRSIISRDQWEKSDTFEILGYVEDLVSTYHMADVFIASSVSDNGPSTVIEAMGCGLPVIVSTHCGIAEYIENGKQGFVYDPFDIETLKDLILWFVRNRSRIPLMGLEARKKALDLEAKDYSASIYSVCCLGLKPRKSKKTFA